MCVGGEAEDEVPTQMLLTEEGVQVPQVMDGQQEAKVSEET